MSEQFLKSYNLLNENQKKAVDTIQGPVMVVAGPGTGKTQILSLRIANILSKTDAKASNILCLSFTEAGVKAMRERLRKFIGKESYDVAIHTFHSFANEIILTFPEKFAFSKELKQLDDLNRIKILKKIIDDLSLDERKYKLIPFHDKYARIKDITSSIQNLKKENITPQNLIEKNNELKKLHEENPEYYRGKLKKAWEKKGEKFLLIDEFAKLYELYQGALFENGFYDYEDMIMFVTEKLSVDDELLAYYQEKYQYIHVDEYQDTNGSQNKILSLLTSFDTSPNIFVVGDDDQAIYRFQGANLENILHFANNFANIEVIPITTNYRSNQNILDLADSLIENNSTRLTNIKSDLNKKLRSVNNRKDELSEVWQFNNADEENIFIAKEIEKLNREGTKFSDIAVLVRKNSHLSDISETLTKFGIPVKIETSKNIFEIEIIKQIVNLLKVIHFYGTSYLDKKEMSALVYNVMLYEFFKLEIVDVYKLANYAYKYKKSLLEVLIDLSDDIKNEINPNQSLIEFSRKIKKWHILEKNIDFPRFVEHLLSECNIVESLDESVKEYSKTFDNLLSLNSFIDFIRKQFEINNDLNLHKFLEDLNLIKENGIKISLSHSSVNKEGVNLITAHSSKGLEFEYVFIAKATSDNWGTNKRNTDIVPKEYLNSYNSEISESLKDISIEDERRLFFVAITRAKSKVYFTYANEYLNFGVISLASASMFINELNENLLEKKGTTGDYKNGLNYKSEDYIKKLRPISVSVIELQERLFLLSEIEKFRLSASSLNQYLRSPLEFKLSWLVKIPRSKTKHECMGTAIHFAMEQLNRNYSNKNEEKLLSLDAFLNYYEESLVKNFFGDDEFERTLFEGKGILTKYYNEVVLAGGIAKSLEVEYNFKPQSVVLDNGQNDAISLEGRIDKIEKFGEGLCDVRIVDYKTGSFKTRNEILGDTKYSNGDEYRQLTFYKLLSELDQYFRPERSFSKPKYIVKDCVIEFVRPKPSGKFERYSFDISESDVADLKNLILEVMKRIRNLEFPEECDLLK